MKHFQVPSEVKRLAVCAKCGGKQYEKGYVVMSGGMGQTDGFTPMCIASPHAKIIHFRKTEDTVLCGAKHKNGFSEIRADDRRASLKRCMRCNEVAKTTKPDFEGWSCNEWRCVKCHAPATTVQYTLACGVKDGDSTAVRADVDCGTCKAHIATLQPEPEDEQELDEP